MVSSRYLLTVVLAWVSDSAGCLEGYAVSQIDFAGLDLAFPGDQEIAVVD